MPPKIKIPLAEFHAEIMYLKTRADKSVDIVLNVGEDDLQAVRQMIDWTKDYVSVAIANETRAQIAGPEQETDGSTKREGAVRKGRKRKPQGTETPAS